MTSAPSPEEGGQLLFQAATYGNVELVEDLLSGEYAGELGWRDAKGWTPLHAAAAAGHSDALAALAAAANPALLDAPANPASGASKTPLHLAAEAGHAQACRCLVEAGADVFVRDAAGHCPLELAQMRQQSDTAAAIIAAIEERRERLTSLERRLVAAVEARDAQTMEAVLEEGGRSCRSALLHGRQDEDYTLLYRVAEKGTAAMAEVVIRLGGDGRVHPVTLYSPAYIAAYAGNLPVLRLLLSRSPEMVQRETFEGWLPLHAAAKTGNVEVARTLLEASYPNWLLSTFSDPQGRRSFRFPFDLNHQDLDLRTPLFIAAEEGHEGVVKVLLDVRVGLRLHGGSAESGAGESREDAVFAVSPSSSERSTGKELEWEYRPVQLDVYSRRGRTPLQVAVSGGSWGVGRLLVEAGANVNLPLAITDEELAALTPAEAEGLQCAGIWFFPHSMLSHSPTC